MGIELRYQLLELFTKEGAKRWLRLGSIRQKTVNVKLWRALPGETGVLGAFKFFAD